MDVIDRIKDPKLWFKKSEISEETKSKAISMVESLKRLNLQLDVSYGNNGEIFLAIFREFNQDFMELEITTEKSFIQCQYVLTPYFVNEHPSIYVNDDFRLSTEEEVIREVKRFYGIKE